MFRRLPPVAFCLLVPALSFAAPADQYTRYCAMCHLPGIHGAPKVGDQKDWAQRVRPGMSMVYRNTLEGVPNTAMLAKGGQAELSETEIKAIVDYMIAANALPASTLKDAARYDKLGITSCDFIRLDANYDGFLSRDEIAGDNLLLRNLARFDDNRDGRLNETEYLKAEATLARELSAIPVDDVTLAATIRKILATIKGLDLENTKVEVKAGTVSMVGIVSTADIAIHAHDAVKRIAGIRKIDNRLVSGDQIGWD